MGAYERQTFEDYKTVLQASHLRHIEDGIVNATVIPNPTLDGTEIDLTSLQIGEAKEEVVTKQVDMAYGSYTTSTSSIGPDIGRAIAILDVKANDIVELANKSSPYDFMVVKVIDGTTTFEKTYRGYSTADWLSEIDQRVIIVARNATYPDPNTAICTVDELLDILKWTTTEASPTLYKINISADIVEELNLSRCDFGKEMTTGIDYYVEGDVITCKAIISNLTGSTLKVFTAVGEGVARGSAYFVNFENGTMGMYGGIASTSSTLTIKYKKTIGFSLTAGHEYVVECLRKAKEHTIRITDAYTLETDSYTVMPSGSGDIGEHWGKRSYRAEGSIEVKSFKNYSLQPYECRLLIIGDSFIEGATGFQNHANRYCMRMKRLLNGSCAVNGFGGATTKHVYNFYESYCKTLFKPEYVLIACGTNNRDYSSWFEVQQKLIKSIKEAGSIPVLVTITRRLDSDNSSFMKEANNWIRNSGELYVDINRITTLNFDGETQNPELFSSDKVHPLPETHALITQKALLDIPEVFNLSSSYIKNRNDFGAL